MKKLVLMCIVLMAGCTAPDRSRETLDNSGFTNIEIGGWAGLSCSDGDTYKTKFSATNPNGKRVTGVVCCGMMKGCTVRF